MKKVLEKDLYSILGVASNATTDEIRKAYLSRTRIIHPDRFNKEEQPQDWNKANEMLAELNEAYSILRDTSSRTQYDNQRADRRHRQNPTESPRPQQKSSPPPPPNFDLGELTSGHAAFCHLPTNVQLRLLKRQKNSGEDQFQIKQLSIARSYLFILILLCWYLYLFSDADGAKWKSNTIIWYAGITFAIGCLIGANCVTIRKWFKSSLKPYFYVTPIYFINTNFDSVSFRPIWTLKDVAITHNYRNGIHQSSDLTLKFDGHNEYLSFSSKNKLESMLDSMETYNKRLKSAYANGDHSYFLSNDDFHKVPRSGVPITQHPSQKMQALIYFAAVLLCGVGLFSAIIANGKLSSKRWVQHPTPATPSSQPALPYAPLPSYPEQPVPKTGAIRTWSSAERIAPFEIKAAQGSHYLLKLIDVQTNSPAMMVFVRSGTTVEIDVPLGTYKVHYASGNTWYGYEYLFGPETSYSKADKTFTFSVTGNRVSGFTITLYKVANGNLHTSTIKPTDF